MVESIKKDARQPTQNDTSTTCNNQLQATTSTFAQQPATQSYQQGQMQTPNNLKVDGEDSDAIKTYQEEARSAVQNEWEDGKKTNSSSPSLPVAVKLLSFRKLSKTV